MRNLYSDIGLLIFSFLLLFSCICPGNVPIGVIPIERNTSTPPDAAADPPVSTPPTSTPSTAANPPASTPPTP